MGTRSLSCRLPPVLLPEPAKRQSRWEEYGGAQRPKRIASPVADRPEPKGKLLFRARLVIVRNSGMIGHEWVSISQAPSN